MWAVLAMVERGVEGVRGLTCLVVEVGILMCMEGVVRGVPEGGGGCKLRADESKCTKRNGGGILRCKAAAQEAPAAVLVWAEEGRGARLIGISVLSVQVIQVCRVRMAAAEAVAGMLEKGPKTGGMRCGRRSVDVPLSAHKGGVKVAVRRVGWGGLGGEGMRASLRRWLLPLASMTSAVTPLGVEAMQGCVVEEARVRAVAT